MSFKSSSFLLTIITGAVFAGTAFAQSAVMSVLRNPYANGVNRPVLVAHRGVFQSPPYLAENTVDALSRAANTFGYGAFEIDIKTLGDGTPIVMHDGSAGRTTDNDGCGGCFNPLFDDQVVNADSGQNIRNKSRSTPANTNFNLNQYENNVHYHKVYDLNANLIGTSDNFGTGSGYYDTLGHFLEASATQNYPNGVLVLDIQTYTDLVASINVVRNANAFGRVVFKCWAQAFPFRSSNGNYVADKNIVGEGNYVISVNPTNLSLNNGGAYLSLYSTTDNRVEALTVVSNYNGLTGAANNVFQSMGSSLFGLETFYNAIGGNLSPVDAWISNNWRIRDLAGIPYPTWGVVREADATLSPDGDNDHAGLPNGNYSFGWDLMNLLTPSTVNTRANFGNLHDIVVKDIQ